MASMAASIRILDKTGWTSSPPSESKTDTSWTLHLRGTCTIINLAMTGTGEVMLAANSLAVPKIDYYILKLGSSSSKAKKTELDGHRGTPHFALAYILYIYEV